MARYRHQDDGTGFIEVCSLIVAVAGFCLALAEHYNKEGPRAQGPQVVKIVMKPDTPRDAGLTPESDSRVPPAVMRGEPQQAVPLRGQDGLAQVSFKREARPQPKGRLRKRVYGLQGRSYGYPAYGAYDYPIINDFQHPY